MKTLFKVAMVITLMSSLSHALTYNCKIDDDTNRVTKAEVYNGKVIVTYTNAKDVPPYVFRHNPSIGYVCTTDKMLFLNLLSDKNEVPYLIEMYTKTYNSSEGIVEIHKCYK